MAPFLPSLRVNNLFSLYTSLAIVGATLLVMGLLILG
jgi:hypothetical protein